VQQEARGAHELAPLGRRNRGERAAEIQAQVIARGLIEAFAMVKPTVPFVVRLDGTNDKEGRALLAEANLPGVYAEATMDGAAAKVVELATQPTSPA